MKKLLSLTLALVMCLSLCACGGGNDSQPGTATTKDDMVNTAETLDCFAVLSDYEGNPINAKEKYTGKIFSFEGYVEKISSSSVTIIPMVTPHKSGLVSVEVYLTLDANDIKKLSTNGVATFVGQVSDVTGCRGKSWGAGLEMNVGYLVDDIVPFEGKVKQITTLTTMDGARYPYVELSKTVGGNEIRYGFAFTDGTDTVGISEGDNIIITAQMKFKQYTKHTDIKGKQYYTFEYYVNTTNSINKA